MTIGEPAVIRTLAILLVALAPLGARPPRGLRHQRVVRRRRRAAEVHQATRNAARRPRPDEGPRGPAVAAAAGGPRPAAARPGPAEQADSALRRRPAPPRGEARLPL